MLLGRRYAAAQPREASGGHGLQGVQLGRNVPFFFSDTVHRSGLREISAAAQRSLSQSVRAVNCL